MPPSQVLKQERTAELAPATISGQALFRSLNRKLLVMALAVLVVMALFTSITITNLIRLREQADALNITTQRAAYAGTFDSAIARAAGELATFAETRNEQYWEEALAAIAQASQAIGNFQSVQPSDTAARDLAAFTERQTEILRLIQVAQHDLGEAYAQGAQLNSPAMLDTIFAYEEQAEALNQQLSSYLQAELTDRQLAVAATVSNALLSVAATVVTFLLMLLLITIVMRRSIVRPIVALSAAANQVAAGNLQHVVGISNSDEIGKLQQSFNTMVLNLRQQHDALELRAAELVYAVNEAESARSFAEESNRSKSMFLATMSHELRTPLTAILGYAQLLRAEAQQHADPSFEQDLAKIELSGKQLLELINDVLDFSQIEAGRAELAVGEFDVAELADQIAVTLAPAVAQNHNMLTVELQPGLGSMCTDRARVRQVLINLLNNAAKFTTAGTITLRVQRVPGAGGDWVEFTIADTGIGISNEQLPLLFQQFTQLDASRSRRYGGIGLGLTLSQRTCQLLGGSILVQSQLGQGSTFTARFPANAPAA